MSPRSFNSVSRFVTTAPPWQPPNVKSKPVRLLTENTGGKLGDLALAWGFLATTLKAAQSMKGETDALDFIKTKTVGSEGDTVKTLRRQVRDWEEIAAKTYLKGDFPDSRL